MPPDPTIIAAVHRLPEVSFGMMTKLITGRCFSRPPQDWTVGELGAVGVDADRAHRLLLALARLSPTNTAESLRRHNLMVITLTDDAYPPLLRQIPSPPPVIYVRGTLDGLRRPTLAVVGTRRPTPYGLRVTRQLVAPVVRAGVTVVSGLALGIDGAAHHLAVEAGTPTIAVLGNGLDGIYPVEHGRLAERIVAGGGALISEFPLGAPPLRHHFPQRNRIISGLARAVLLVEAGERSGALVTAKFAVEQNRDVLCVPGPIDAPRSVGPMNWIKLGATPVTSPDDIFRSLEVTPTTVPVTTTVVPANDEERRLVDALALGPLHIDELSEKSRLDSSVVSATLSLLELRGAVHHLGGLVYTLT